MTVEAEASIILATAMERDETVELWLSGKAQRAHPYGIRTATEDWYSDAFSAYTRADAWRWVLRSILTLPAFGLGVLFFFEAAIKFHASTKFAPRHSREVFQLGYEAGVLGRKADVISVEQRQAA